MEILLPDNTNFNLNQPTSKLIDSKMCVLDYADKDNVDFYMNGLVLLDFNFKPFLVSDAIIKNPKCVKVIGNTITNNIKEII